MTTSSNRPPSTAHWALTYIHTHGLLVQVLFSDRLHGASPTPSPFELIKVEARTGGVGFRSARDTKDCRRIQDEGGLGLPIAIFQYGNTAPEGSESVPCLIERYALTERREQGRGYARVSNWGVLKNMVKGHINVVALPEMLDRLEAVELPAVNGMAPAFSATSLGISFAGYRTDLHVFVHIAFTRVGLY